MSASLGLLSASSPWPGTALNVRLNDKTILVSIGNIGKNLL
jgi:hypothetical protein